MSKDIKKALEHCIEWNCGNCPNREELGSGETVCRGRLLPEVLEYVADLEAKLAEYEKFMKDNEWGSVDAMQETLNKCEKKYFDIQKQLAELEEQLKNSIRPKFKIGQEVWFVSDPYTARYAKVRHMKIEEISISSIFVERGVMYAGDDWAGISESELFATEEEAKAKLKGGKTNVNQEN